MAREGGTEHARPTIEGLSGDNLGSVPYFVLFPNSLVSLHPDYAMLQGLMGAVAAFREGPRASVRQGAGSEEEDSLFIG